MAKERDVQARYPLGEHVRGEIRSASGRPLADLTLEALRAGELEAGDLRIHADTLLQQASIAEEAGFPQLGANFRRASELTRVPNEKVLALYEALRPYRVTEARLRELADELEHTYGANENAALLREAAKAYSTRGLFQ